MRRAARADDHRRPLASWRVAHSSLFIGSPAQAFGAIAGILACYLFLEVEGMRVPLDLWLAHPFYYGWWAWLAGGAAICGAFDLAVRLAGHEVRQNWAGLIGLLALLFLAWRLSGLL